MIESSDKAPRCLCGCGPRRLSVHRSRDVPVTRVIARLLVIADLAWQASDVYQLSSAEGIVAFKTAGNLANVG
jgi:hypothetical protein